MAEENKDLAKRSCEPCTGDTPTLEGEELQEFYRKLGEGWKLVDEHHLEKEFIFESFRPGLEFVVAVGEMSEEEGHHPVVRLEWGKVTATIHTHAIDGLSENDFIWAAKADKIYEEQ